jgi:hypothetical protein
MKYHLLSGCLFLKEKYVKNTNGMARDVTTSKQELISRCIEENAKDYDKGIWDKNVRLRIYFDKTIHSYLPLGFIKKNAHINNIYCLSHG